MKIEQLAERVQQIRSAGPDAVIKQRVAETAQELNRAGEMQKRVELANEALAALTVLCYQKDIDGQWANVDPKTWRLLVPAPWGNAGWRTWGMRQWESRCLRWVLLDRQGGKGDRPPLFDYNEAGRTWHLNLGDYKTLEQGLFWVKVSAIRLAEWRKYVDRTRQGTRERMSRLKAQRRG